MVLALTLALLGRPPAPAFVTLTAFPMTPNWKIDRKAAQPERAAQAQLADRRQRPGRAPAR